MTRVIICCGVGGVGKTTTAAALSLALAQRGERVVVLTIDPAKRLADALGLEGLGNVPRPIELPPNTEGTLHALMLDQKQTWDEVIRRFSPSEETTDRLLSNHYYQAVSERLSGSHEYMAVEKLYDLVSTKSWDVVVVDTPPAQHTLDFFRAPDRVQRILNRTALRAFLRPGKGLVGAATSRAMSVFNRIAGATVLGDIHEFFELISGLSGGFRERSEAVRRLLSSPQTSYYLVASAANPHRSNFLAFLDVLRERDMRVAGFILNRHQAGLQLPGPAEILDAPAPPEGCTEAHWQDYWSSVLQAVQRHIQMHNDELNSAHTLCQETRAPIWLVPDYPYGISSIKGLALMANHLPPHADPSVEPQPKQGS
jgi:anion-transporting  ArsA/GET3 family ATPase